MAIEDKIAEIIRNRVCTVCSARHGCSAYWQKANSVCCADFLDTEKDIAALIAEEQRPLVEALKNARFVIKNCVDAQKWESSQANMLNMIDKALEGVK
jgi:hypothetical protein